MKSLWKLVFAYFYNKWIWFLFMVFMEKSRIYQIGRVSHRPSFSWTEIWNHATWLHDVWEISYLEIRLICWQSVKWRTRRSSTQSCVLIKSTIILTRYSSWFTKGLVNMIILIRLSVIRNWLKKFKSIAERIRRIK